MKRIQKKQKRIKKVFTSIVLKQGEEPVTLVNFGDWAAQWDELEEAWYESFSDVGESRVWFASKNLTPCRMH